MNVEARMTNVEGTFIAIVLRNYFVIRH